MDTVKKYPVWLLLIIYWVTGTMILFAVIGTVRGKITFDWVFNTFNLMLVATFAIPLLLVQFLADRFLFRKQSPSKRLLLSILIGLVAAVIVVLLFARKS